MCILNTCLTEMSTFRKYRQTCLGNTTNEQEPVYPVSKVVLTTPLQARKKIHIHQNYNYQLCFESVLSRLNWPITFNGTDLKHHQLTDKHCLLDSEDDFCSGCQTFSHQQQLFLELHIPSPRCTNYWYSWVQTIFTIHTIATYSYMQVQCIASTFDLYSGLTHVHQHK